MLQSGLLSVPGSNMPAPLPYKAVSTGSKQREMPVEIVQMRQQEKPEAERKNLISGSLQKASGKMGDALQGFLNLALHLVYRKNKNLKIYPSYEP